MSEGGIGGCGVARGLDHALGIEVSADGRHVYTAGRGSDAIAVFSRNANSGALTQLAGAAGCLHDSVTSTSGLQGCADARGLDGAYSMTLSSDDQSAYVASRVSDAACGLQAQRGRHADPDRGTGRLHLLRECSPTAGRQAVPSTAPRTSRSARTGSERVRRALRRRRGLDPGARRTTGALSYVGCLTQDSTSPECAAARALDYADAVEVDAQRTQRVRRRRIRGRDRDLRARAPTGRWRRSRPRPATVGRRLPQLARSQVGRERHDLSQPDHSDHYCARALALYYPYALELGPGGSELYVASTESDTVSMYRRLDTRGYARPKGAAPVRIAARPRVPAVRRHRIACTARRSTRRRARSRDSSRRGLTRNGSRRAS